MHTGFKNKEAQGDYWCGQAPLIIFPCAYDLVLEIIVPRKGLNMFINC
jgi:hypothetical protein